VGGTSAASPSFAGLMGLVVQSTGARQGNANSVFYALAGKQKSGGAPVFHDITSGNNAVPGLTGYSANAGYDLATGLGSVDANLLVTHWSDAVVVPTFQFSGASSSLAVGAGGSATLSYASAASGGFNAAITLSSSGLPVGVTALFTPAKIAAPGSGSSVLKLTAASTARAASTAASIVAISGGITRTAPLTVTITPPPTYTLTASPGSLAVLAGQQGTINLTSSGNSSFNAAVALSAAGLPVGVTAGFSPASIGAPGSGSSSLTLAASSSTAPGAYALTTTGLGGGITQKASLTLNIPGFSLTGSATAGTVAPKGKTTLTLTTKALGGFSSAITFSLSGSPSGVTAAFSPAAITAPGNGSSVLTLTRGTTGGVSTAKITVTATGGGMTRTQILTLNLTAK
jgi:hypothetical protein